MTALQRAIALINSKVCDNAEGSTHYIKDGGCISCDRSTRWLAHHYGITSI